MAYRLGRLPPIPDRPRLKLDRILRAVPHPPAADYLAAMGGGWQLLGNDQYGDCVAVSGANVRRLVTKTLTGHETYWTLPQTLAFYKTQNPGFPAQDNGMVIQLALEELQQHGGPDGVKAVAFADVDLTRADVVEAAIAIFGSLWTGITVTRANEQQFAAGQPWTNVVDSPVLGGHSVVSGGYTAATGADPTAITWGQEVSFTAGFWREQAEEAWVVIWPEHLGSKAFLEGVDQEALRSDFTALTGKSLPTADGCLPAALQRWVRR